MIREVASLLNEGTSAKRQCLKGSEQKSKQFEKQYIFFDQARIQNAPVCSDMYYKNTFVNHARML